MFAGFIIAWTSYLAHYSCKPQKWLFNSYLIEHRIELEILLDTQLHIKYLLNYNISETALQYFQ